MEPLIFDVRHLYPRLIQDLSSVRTMLCFFKLYNCPLSTTTRYSSHAHCTLLHIYFHCDKIFHQNSHLCTQYVSHATNLAQRGPPRGTTPPPAPVMDVLVTSIDRACVESATDVLGARPRARSVELRTALNGAVCGPVDTAQHIDGLGLPMDGSDPRGHSPGRP